MEIFILKIPLIILLHKNVLCENVWKIPQNDILKRHGQETLEKTSIIGYDKAKMEKSEIETEKKRLEKECQCKVENLENVGAFILTYNIPNHARAMSLHLDLSKEIGVEDQLLTLSNHEIPTDRSDPDFNQQWALQDLSNNADINAAEGWRKYMADVKGSDPKGPSVVIAVIDTGIDYNHPDLKDVMWNNPKEIPGNRKDDDGNGFVDDFYGYDFSYDDGDPMDYNGHGTHCAGIIAAKENNGKGIRGVASFTQGKVKIMAIKGCKDGKNKDDKGCEFSKLLKSLEYAISNGATISSISWGGSYLDNRVERLWSMVLKNNPNHLFVASAGNSWIHLESDIGNSYRRMACGVNEPNLLCVASSTKQDEKSSFSNYGRDYVDVFAPGSNIYSTFLGGGYKSMSGTSMACPHVAGLAALIRTMNPELSAQEVKEVILANVEKKAHYKGLVGSGGLIDMGRTIRALKCSGQILFKSYGGASEFQGDTLGYYDLMPKLFNRRPAYQQCGGSFYMYNLDGSAWVVSKILGGKKRLSLGIKSHGYVPPTSGWKYGKHGSSKDDTTLILSLNPTVMCRQVKVSSAGPASDKYPRLMGLYSWTGEWQSGWKVYSKDNTSGIYLSIRTGESSWGIRHEKDAKKAWILQCKRLCPNNWQYKYWDQDEWKTDLSVKIKCDEI